jgi:hypothetical protein
MACEGKTTDDIIYAYIDYTEKKLKELETWKTKLTDLLWEKAESTTIGDSNQTLSGTVEAKLVNKGKKIT